MNGAQALVAQLQAEGVDVVFGIPGGAVLPLYDALYGAPLRHVLVRHEQAAALAADGYARVTGRPGVCIATSGPGAMNLVTGLATSYMDSVPVVAITGNVATAVMGTDAFQEADTFGTTMPVTKHNYLVKDPADLLPVLAEAFEVARSGRPGPVLVDIPKDVFLAPVGDSLAEAAGNRRPWARNGRAPAPCEATVAAAARAIAGARQPVLYAGGGVITAGAADVLRSLVEQAGIPVTTTLMALGSVPVDHPLFLGMPGMHGTYAANMALTETDCLIAVGARFDDRVTGRLAEFAPQAAVIHVDIDAAEHGKIRAPQFPIVADARDGLEALLKALDGLEHNGARREWIQRVQSWKQEHPLEYDRSAPEILPQAVIEEISRATGGDAVIVTGVGQHQMWTAMLYAWKRPRQLLTSGGLGTMGYSLPAAIGAKIARPGDLVVCVDGDGSFQMNVQELATVAEQNLPLKIFIINNGCHGMVRQWQQLFHGNRLSASVFAGNPDFVRLAEAYGIRGLRIDDPARLPAGVREALEYDGPVVVDCIVRQEENVLPMVPPGAALREMIER
ncbi:MAG: biosynthetic-type acetolactate synthase large subunit [Bacillota bacterium]|nr:acetolactate synthase, large subunit, biosynthetic type [Bacillota bacterium]